MITVVIPTHNRLDRLSSALHSIYNQTVFPDEIIVVDDFSSPKVTEEIFFGCPEEIKYKIIRNEKSLKASGARNIGILNSESKYIAFLDDDDQFLKNKIENIVEVINKNNLPDVVYHAASIFMVNEGVTYYTKPESSDAVDFKNKILISNIVGGTPMVVAKRSSLIEAGLFDSDLPALEDYELWLRMALKNFKFKSVNEVYTKCFYTTKEGSVSKNVSANSNARNLIFDKYSKYYLALDFFEKKQAKEAVMVDDLQRFLLNYQYRKSVKQAFNIMKHSFTMKNIVRLSIVLLGSKFSFKVRSWI